MKTIKNLKAEEIRKSILQLAIQGKLVKQNPNDEPASELVKRIYEEKKKLIKEGKIKKDKNESFIFKGDDNCYYEKIGNNEPVKLEDLPFDIPDNWMWVRHNAIFEIFGGSQPPKDKFIQFPKEGYIRLYQIRDYGPKPDPVYIPIKDAHKITRKGDILLARYGASVGKVFFAEDGAYNVAMAKVEKLFSNSYISDSYLYTFYKSELYQNLVLNNSRSAQTGFNKEDLNELLFPLPPLEEQQRIVDKINSFEPLLQEYDKYEKQLSELESSFAEKLKKSILQYAIEGKLVKQDPNDEPASVLLERIKTEKEKLIKEGKIKRDKNESYIYQGDDKNYYENLLSLYHEFITPKNWICVNLIEVCQFIQRGKSPNYSVEMDVPVIAQKCNQKNGILSLEKALFISFESLKKYNETKQTKINDIILNSTGGGTVGRVGIVDNSLFKDYKHIVTDSHITTIRVLSEINPLYAYYYLISPIIFDHVEEKCEGSTNQIELYAKVIMSYPFPLPPKKEQDRIVEKISSINNYL